MRTEVPSRPGRSALAWEFLLAGRPLLALAAVWLTTAGHTMNFRELGAAHGWVPAEFFSLQTCYLFSIALTLLACPHLGQHCSCLDLTRVGLLALAAASFWNGLAVHAELLGFLAGRLVAGVGAGLVIFFAPRLLDNRWSVPKDWATILLPVIGPGVIAAASMLHGTSDWEWGFLFEGGIALSCLMLLLSMGDAPESPPSAPRGSPAFLVPLALTSSALGYCLHWGQLQGWSESFEVVAVAAAGAAGLALTLFLIWPRLDLRVLRENGWRLLLIFFGGLSQYFHGYTMNVYGGTLINFDPWQRSWLILSMPLGVGVSLTIAQLLRRQSRGQPLGLPGAIVGLVILAGGLFLSHRVTLDWPFWQVSNQVDLNWFAAPQHWQLAPSRFLMGFGVGLLMTAAETGADPDPAREGQVRPLLPVSQFLGGGVGAGLFVTWLLIGLQVQYSYAADRDYIQAAEIAERRSLLDGEIARAGGAIPDRETDALLYRAVRYESENLVYANIYGTLAVVSLLLACLTLGQLAWRGLRAVDTPAS